MSSAFYPSYAPILGGFGAVCGLSLSCFGAAYGTAKSSIGVFSVGVMKPQVVMRSIIPIIMAGILGIYGLVISMLIIGKIDPKVYSIYAAAMHLSAGLTVGLTALASGFAIGIAGEAGVLSSGKEPKTYVGMILIMIFAEVLGLYGLIVGMIFSSKV